MLPATFELAREARFISLQQLQGRRFFGEFTEGEGDPRGFVDGYIFLLEIVRHAVHLIFEEVGFYSPGALLTPASDSHLLDEEVLGRGGGSVRGPASRTFR